MTETKRIAEQFLAAFSGGESSQYDAILAEDAGMRMARWDGGEAYRPRTRVVARLMEEWAGWSDASLECLSITANADRAAIEFRIQGTENGRFMEHHRCAVLTIQDGLVQTIDMYCPAPLPSARRKGWIAPATLSDEELNRLFDSMLYSFDIREWIPPNMTAHISSKLAYGGSLGAHPGSNWVGGACLTAEEADRIIEDKITYFRERNSGFTWLVSSFDTPPDLGKRMEQHGFALAGDQAIMARVGLDDLSDIAINPDIEIEVVDGSNDDSIEAGLQIRGACFNWTAEQIAERRPGTFERMRNRKTYETEVFYLGRLNGIPVADAHLVFQCGIAYLGGAATLREYRKRKIYSTMLRRRLADAAGRGYHIAAIHAEPMSRRVVKRYNFKEYARAHVYAWMPEMDMQVIKSLVPDE